VSSYISLFLANHDWRFQVYVDDHEKLMVTWLEEHVLDVTEEHILGERGAIFSVDHCTSPSTGEPTDLLRS
jgi:hypothetical protein